MRRSNATPVLARLVSRRVDDILSATWLLGGRCVISVLAVLSISISLGIRLACHALLNHPYVSTFATPTSYSYHPPPAILPPTRNLPFLCYLPLSALSRTLRDTYPLRHPTHTPYLIRPILLVYIIVHVHVHAYVQFPQCYTTRSCCLSAPQLSQNAAFVTWLLVS